MRPIAMTVNKFSHKVHTFVITHKKFSLSVAIGVMVLSCVIGLAKWRLTQKQIPSPPPDSAAEYKKQISSLEANLKNAQEKAELLQNQLDQVHKDTEEIYAESIEQEAAIKILQKQAVQAQAETNQLKKCVLVARENCSGLKNVQLHVTQLEQQIKELKTDNLRVAQQLHDQMLIKQTLQEENIKLKQHVLTAVPGLKWPEKLTTLILPGSTSSSQDIFFSDNPESFCNWVESRFKKFSDVKKLIELHHKEQECERLISIIPDILNEINDIRDRICDIKPRVDPHFFEDLSRTYQTNSDKKCSEANRIHDMLHVCPDAPYEFVRQRYEAVVSYLQESRFKYHEALARFESILSCMRQCSSVVRTPFSWANYCAYLNGQEAVAELSRNVPVSKVTAICESLPNIKAEFLDLQSRLKKAEAH